MVFILYYRYYTFYVNLNIKFKQFNLSKNENWID